MSAFRAGEKPRDALATSKLSLSSCLTVPSWIDWLRKSMTERTRRCLFDMAVGGQVEDGAAQALAPTTANIIGRLGQQSACWRVGRFSTSLVHPTRARARCPLLLPPRPCLPRCPSSAPYLESPRWTLLCQQSLAMSTSGGSSSSTSTRMARTPLPERSSRRATSSV